MMTTPDAILYASVIVMLIGMIGIAVAFCWPKPEPPAPPCKATKAEHQLETDPWPWQAPHGKYSGRDQWFQRCTECGAKQIVTIDDDGRIVTLSSSL